MKNLYDGVVVADKKGEAFIPLPRWFEALNHEFRYQLTAVEDQHHKTTSNTLSKIRSWAEVKV